MVPVSVGFWQKYEKYHQKHQLSLLHQDCRFWRWYPLFHVINIRLCLKYHPNRELIVVPLAYLSTKFGIDKDSLEPNLKFSKALVLVIALLRVQLTLIIVVPTIQNTLLRNLLKMSSNIKWVCFDTLISVTNWLEVWKKGLPEVEMVPNIQQFPGYHRVS